MANFIEEFYYGNLDPQARSTKENKTVQKQMEVLMLNEDFLTEHLSGESKKKFLDFCNAWGVVNGESNLDSLIWKNEGPAYDELHKAIVRHITEKLNNPNNIY